MTLLLSLKSCQTILQKNMTYRASAKQPSHTKNATVYIFAEHEQDSTNNVSDFSTQNFSPSE